MQVRVMPNQSETKSAIRKRALTVAGVVLLGFVLASCDKCGNSIFKVDAGPFACRDERPRS